MKDLKDALDIVWKQREEQSEQEINRITRRIKDLKVTISNQATAAIEPSNAAIKEVLMEKIANSQNEVSELESQLTQLKYMADTDKERFLSFAFDFIKNMGERFLEISPINRLRCKQLTFPAGFYVDANNKVYTPEISLLYRLGSNKKDLPNLEKSFMVRVQGL